MNRKTLLLFTCIACLAAGPLTTRAQKAPEYIYPTAPFDEAATEKLIEPGTGVVKGYAYMKVKGKETFPDKGRTVLLFPVTPYLLEFLELKKKYPEGGKKEASMVNAAFTYRIQAKFIDDRGNFIFTGVKPGKYVLLAYLPYEKKKGVSLQTGEYRGINLNTGAFESAPIYTRYRQYFKYEKEMTSFIEVKSEGEVVSTVFSNETQK